MSNIQRQKTTAFLVNLGLLANIFLAVLKSVIGVWGKSSALLADGINSTSDVVYLFIVKIYMKHANKPADAEHPYGHTQLETIASIVVGAFVLTTAVAIFWDSLNKAYVLLTEAGDAYSAHILTLYAAIFTVLLKVLLTVITYSKGKGLHSSTVMAIAADHKNDIFSALAASVGIFLGRLGFFWVDPFAGALVAVFILRTGIEILGDASNELMTSVPPKKLLDEVHTILSKIPEILALEDVHIHKYGPYMVANITIGIDGNNSVNTGDAIASAAERLLLDEVDFLKKVVIHYHPGKVKSE